MPAGRLYTAWKELAMLQLVSVYSLPFVVRLCDLSTRVLHCALRKTFFARLTFSPVYDVIVYTWMTSRAPDTGVPRAPAAAAAAHARRDVQQLQRLRR